MIAIVIQSIETIIRESIVDIIYLVMFWEYLDFKIGYWIIGIIHNLLN